MGGATQNRVSEAGEEALGGQLGAWTDPEASAGFRIRWNLRSSSSPHFGFIGRKERPRLGRVVFRLTSQPAAMAPP